MTGFVDEYAPDCLHNADQPVEPTPRFSTSIAVDAGGGEQRNRNWSEPLWRFLLPGATQEMDHFEDVLDHFLTIGGPHISWPWPNPVDMASCRMVRPGILPAISRTDQVIGTGDGYTDTFQLIKTRTRGSRSFIRTVHLPVVASVILGVDGVDATQAGAPGGPYTFTVSRPGGAVTFSAPPPDGAAITAGFYFDYEVRYADDEALRAVIEGHKFGGHNDITLEEVRPC